MTIDRLDHNISTFFIETKQACAIFSDDVDECIKDIAFMKFWGMSCMFGGGWFFWTARDFIEIASPQVLDIALASTWVAIGILLMVAGHDVYKIAKNRQILEKTSSAVQEFVRVGYLREKMNQPLSSTSNELDKSAYQTYQSYKKVVVKGTWFPIPSLWLRMFPVRNG